MTSAAKTSVTRTYEYKTVTYTPQSNDGSNIVYYPVWPDPVTSDWVVVVFQRGQWAHESGSGTSFDIQTRNASLTSSSGWAANIDLATQIGGVLDDNIANNPTFYDAAQIFVPYTTSDCWTGNTTASYKVNNTDTSIEFRGFVSFRAMALTILESANAASYSKILWIGQDASGWGLMHHWPWLYDATVAAGFECYGVCDGWLPFAETPYTGTDTKFTSDCYTMTQWWGVPTELKLEWDAATLTQRMTPAQRARFMVMAFQTSTNWMDYQGVDVASISSAEAAWINQSAANMRAHERGFYYGVSRYIPWYDNGTAYASADAIARFLNSTYWDTAVATDMKPREALDDFTSGQPVIVVEPQESGGFPSV